VNYLMTNFEKVKQFMETFGQEVVQKAKFPSKEIVSLRNELIEEELQELRVAAILDNDLVEVADALGDMLYILCGTILSHGMQYKIAEVFEEIQRSNMSKLDKDGQPIYREDGKVMKSELYFKPNIQKILDK